MKNRTENISVRYRPQDLTKSHNLWRVFYYLVILLFFSNKVFIYP